MNKNLLKVIVSEFTMIGMILATFFTCRYFGMEDEMVVGITFITGVVFVFVAVAAAAFAVTVSTTAFATFAVAAAAVAAITTFITGVVIFTVAAVPANGFIWPIIIAIITIVTFLAVFQEYKLPRVWAAFSYIVEAAAISLPIYLAIK